MTLQDISYITASVLCLLTCGLLIVLLGKLRRQERRVNALREELGEALARVTMLERAKGEKPVETPDTVDAEMLRAQLKARPLSPPGGSAPEKYRYLASMACHGMKAEEIAEVLKISPREAEQLVKLAQVARRSD